MLAKATLSLKSPQTCRCIKLKLTKKGKPCLTCEIEMSTHLKHSRMCTHDIPVEIIPRKNWPDFHLPSIPPFDVSMLKTYTIIFVTLPKMYWLILVYKFNQNICSAKLF